MLNHNSRRLCKQIQYEFKTIELLEHALTHRSANSKNNERLEFLGDSLLNLVITSALFQQFVKLSEGELSRIRALLVKGETLSEIALEIGLGDCLILGIGEKKSGGHKRASILADTLEALFAAVYLDSGFDTCKDLILRLYTSRLEATQLQKQSKDPKTELQEYLQARKIALPSYTLVKIEGSDHNQIFHIHCDVKNKNLHSEGKGFNRRKAEQEAALKLLEEIRNR